MLMKRFLGIIFGDSKEYREEQKKYEGLPAKEEKLAKEKAAFDKEKRQQKAIAEIKKRYGKNAILKGMNFEEAGTTKDRNEQIGGHKA